MALDKEVPTDTPAEDEAADVHLNANEGTFLQNMHSEEKDVRKINLNYVCLVLQMRRRIMEGKLLP